MTNLSKAHAGLSTGIKLERYSRSILRQVQTISTTSREFNDLHQHEHFGVEPMLLALAMEFALKAWFVWDYDQHEPIKTHDLSKLFRALAPASQTKLKTEFRIGVAPFHSGFGDMHYEISDILEHHANAFVEWRYLHELQKGTLAFNTSIFTATLELVLDEFGKRYVSRRNSPQLPY